MDFLHAFARAGLRGYLADLEHFALWFTQTNG
jgi:hypothetical protein